MSQFERYEFLMNPGELLLTAPGVYDTYEVLEGRRAAFLSATGLMPDEVVFSPLMAMPIPLCGYLGDAPAPGQYDTRRAFPRVSAEALRNPLFWLPQSLYERQVRPEPNGDPDDLWAAGEPAELDPSVPPQFERDIESGHMVETDAAWAVRVAVTLTEAGMYEAVTQTDAGVAATWLDVLATVGMDPADVGDAERIAAWQAGAFDPDLDGIDLAPHIDLGPEGWALDHVRLIWPLIWRVSWGRLAASLEDQWSWLSLLGDLVAGSGVDHEDPDQAEQLTVLAAETVGDMVDTTPSDEALGSLIVTMAKVLGGEQIDSSEGQLMAWHLGPTWGEQLPMALAVLASKETRRLLRHVLEALGPGYPAVEADFEATLTDPGEAPDPAVALILEQMRRVLSGQSDAQVSELAQVLAPDADPQVLYRYTGQVLCGPFSDGRALVTAARLAYADDVREYDEQIVPLAS
ncbi:hypothetical protein CHO01_31950 [Cellulomonas hominis]|uniref:Uncharacterized protein n=1 Tax=Cellulomonas hominis TaxID=156981 RepID=A0A511FFP6_9CELL|nr:hypothetical protein [Cellulomonas hominis]MBB5474855.1 hypothetical protein [Cellulomonas hominis]NKY05939.1 hypothetical protein [Cellulomonas hominis]GEL48079.1 hypothetical protein CHO01_31950 [Cellulomonas hominis]